MLWILWIFSRHLFTTAGKLLLPLSTCWSAPALTKASIGTTRWSRVSALRYSQRILAMSSRWIYSKYLQRLQHQTTNLTFFSFPSSGLAPRDQTVESWMWIFPLQEQVGSWFLQRYPCEAVVAKLCDVFLCRNRRSIWRREGNWWRKGVWIRCMETIHEKVFISSVGLNATNNTVKVLFCLSFYSMFLMLGDLFLCKYFSILLPFLFCRNFDRRKTIDAKILYLK